LPDELVAGEQTSVVRNLVLLVRAIRRYETVRQQTEIVSHSRAAVASVACSNRLWASRLDAAGGLVDDFIERGPWRRLREERRPGNGLRIDWHRTVVLSPALIGPAGVIHDPAIFAARCSDASDPLWCIWAECLRRAFGLFALPSPTFVARVATSFRDREALRTCRDHRGRLFDDRSREIVSALIAMLDTDPPAHAVKQASNLEWLRMEREEYLWEAVVRNALTGGDFTDDRTDLPALPIGSWQASGEVGHSGGLLFDCRTLIDGPDGRWLVIADAKRYSGHRSVTAGDVYKQWLYAYFSSASFAAGRHPPTRIANVLVLPSRDPTGIEFVASYRLHRGVPPESRWNELSRVVVMRLGYREALRLFAAGRCWPGLTNRIVEACKHPVPETDQASALT
jgi:hypothetical protein